MTVNRTVCTRVIAGAAASLLAVLAGGGHAASAATDPLVLVQGYVYDRGGLPVQSASVTLWHTDYSALMVVDDSAVQTQIARVKTDIAGRYSFRVDPATLPSTAKAEGEANGGSINFEISVKSSDGTQTGLTSFGRDFEAGAWTSPTAESVTAEADTTSNVEVATDAEWTGEVAPAASTSTAAVTPVGSYCSWRLSSESYSWTKILDLHSTSRTRGAWEYGTTAASSIDVGIQYSAGGPFTVSGSRSIENYLSSKVRADFSGALHTRGRTQFLYRTFVLRPENSAATYCTNITNRPGAKQVMAIKWHGSGSYVDTLSAGTCSSSWPAAKRNYYGAGFSMNKEQVKTQKISGAVSVGGASLGAVSTYKKAVKLGLNWNTAGYACGNNDSPPYSQIVYVQ